MRVRTAAVVGGLVYAVAQPGPLPGGRMPGCESDRQRSIFANRISNTNPPMFPRRQSQFIRLELDPLDLFEANELLRRLLFLFPAVTDPVGNLGPWLHPLSVALCTAADARFRDRDVVARQSFIDYVVARITEERIAQDPSVVFGDVVSAHLHAAIRRMSKQLAESRDSIERLRVSDDSEEPAGDARLTPPTAADPSSTSC